MLERLSLNEIHNQARDYKSRCRDYTIMDISKNMYVRDYDNAIRCLTTEGLMTFPMRRSGQSMLCNKVGATNSYIEKLQNVGAHELAAENMNFWINRSPLDLIARTYENEAMSFPGLRYCPFDMDEITDVLCDTINENEWIVKGSYVNEERLHIRMVNREPLDSNDDLYFGLFVDSSDICQSSLIIRIGIYKKVCTNGLMISRAGGTLFRQRHYSITKEEFRCGVISALEQIPELFAKVRDWVKNAKKKEITSTNIDELIEEVKAKASVSEETAKKIVNLMDYYGRNKWGLINGITEVAQEFSLDERLRLEEVAGNLLIAA